MSQRFQKLNLPPLIFLANAIEACRDETEYIKTCCPILQWFRTMFANLNGGLVTPALCFTNIEKILFL